MDFLTSDLNEKDLPVKFKEYLWKSNKFQGLIINFLEPFSNNIKRVLAFQTSVIAKNPIETIKKVRAQPLIQAQFQLLCVIHFLGEHLKGSFP